MTIKECDEPDLPVMEPRAEWSVEKVLSLDAESMDIGCDETVEVGPQSSNVYNVKLKEFRDLQLLGFVPRRIDEDTFMGAVRSDDAAALEYVLAHPDQAPDCECRSKAGVVRESAFRRQYETIRRSFNPTLASVMAKGTGVKLDWDSPLVGVARNRVLTLPLKGGLEMLFSKNITINRGATLSVDKKLKVLLANNIYIHDTGTLTSGGSYLRIWANSISRWNDIVAIRINPDDRPVWALNQ